MPNYYDSNKATSANSRKLILNGADEQHFPFEGLYMGSLCGGDMELPALIDKSKMHLVFPFVDTLLNEIFSHERNNVIFCSRNFQHVLKKIR